MEKKPFEKVLEKNPVEKKNPSKKKKRCCLKKLRKKPSNFFQKKKVFFFQKKSTTEKKNINRFEETPLDQKTAYEKQKPPLQKKQFVGEKNNFGKKRTC